MSFQLASTDSITVVLAAAPATNQLPINTSYVDQGGPGNNLPVLTTGTTPVTIVGSPASGVERLVSQISIPNADTASATVTISLVRSSTSYRLCKITLQSGYQLFYDGGWKVLDTNGNFLCDVTVTGGSITSNQGTAAALAGAWPVEFTDGTNVLGTSTHPIRIDPTGTTAQPVSIGSTVSTNLAQLNGSDLAGPTAWGTAPTSGSQVLNVNANIVSGGSSGGNVNVTQWNTVSLGSPSNYGTSPGAVSVIGVNAFVTNLPATQAINETQLAGTNLGAPSNYGTSPGAVSVQGVNAFVTNMVAVSGTFWQTTQPVSLASLPSLPSGTNTIGSVNQASAPWSFNLTQVAGTIVATPTAYGTAPSSGNVPAVNANVTNTVAISDPSAPTTSAVVTFSSSVSSSSFATSSAKHLCGLLVTAISVTSSLSGLVVKDGGGTTILDIILPNFTSITNSQVYFLSGLALTMNNGSNAPTCSISSGTITTGSIYITLFYN